MRRIGNLIRYLLVLIVNIMFMLVFQSYINFILLLGAVMFLIYSLIGVYQVKRHLKLKLEGPLEPMRKQEELNIRFVLQNPTWFPLINATIKVEVENEFYGEKGSHTLNVPVRAKQNTVAEYVVQMDYSGCLKVKAESVHLMDLLGIVDLTVESQECVQCLILPSGVCQNQEAGRIYVHGVTEAVESKEKGYDFSEVNGIREYIPGDKLQNIHWKLSVKKDSLMVKERVSVSAQQLNVLVELANDKEMALDCVLDLVDGITRAFVAQNLPFTLYYYSTNMGALRECYIGNEIERLQWLQMLLYDKCYEETGLVESMYLQEHMNGNPYLYIGFVSGNGNTEYSIYGMQETVAELRGAM